MIELPGGKRVTVKVPVIVTPKTTPIVVEVGTPITEDDVKKHVDLPDGWKITKVGEIPKTNTPGDKPSVTVELELPDGRRVTVEVPIKVLDKNTKPFIDSGRKEDLSSIGQELPNTGTMEKEIFTPAVLAILAGLGIAIPSFIKKEKE